MGPNRCDVFFKDGSWFELAYKEFDKIDRLMVKYTDTGSDAWVACIGATGARVRFLLSQVQSMQECTHDSRETQRAVERLYKLESPGDWIDD